MASIIVGAIVLTVMVSFFIRLAEECRKDDFDNEHVQFLYREDIYYGDDIPRAPVEFFTRDGKVVDMGDKGAMRTGS